MSRLECQFGLLEYLVQHEILLPHRIDRINEYKNNRSKQSEALINIIISLQRNKSAAQIRLHGFLNGLKVTQKHLWNYVAHDGSKYGIQSTIGNRPTYIENR